MLLSSPSLWITYGAQMDTMSLSSKQLCRTVCRWQAAAIDVPGLPKREVGQITGTNADLRRLSMDKAREILLTLGQGQVTEEMIQGAPLTTP